MGATGATGPVGPTGATGPAGPAGVSGYEVVTSTGLPCGGAPFGCQNGALVIQVATCPAGKKAISGAGFPVLDTGVSGTVDRVAIHFSGPTSLNNDNDTWDIQAFEAAPDNFTTWHLVVSAVCVSA